MMEKLIVAVALTFILILGYGNIGFALTSDDILQIQKIVRDEVESLRQEFKAEIKATEDRLKAEIKATEDRLNRRIDDKYNIIIWALGLIILLFGIPQFWSWIAETRRAAKERSSELVSFRDRLKQIEDQLKSKGLL
jgi:ABC-type dipeptide/oligopeptide/nickel transport system permease subunit